MISVACQCGNRLKVDPEHAGRSIRCPECGAGVVVPDEGSDSDEAERRARRAERRAGRAERIERPNNRDLPEPKPTPVKERVQAIPDTHGSPVRREAEPSAYFWADFLAGVVNFLAVAQLVITVLVVIVRGQGSGAGPTSGDGPRPDTTGSGGMTLAFSFGLAVSSVLAASVVRVILDAARTLRRIREEMAK